MNKLPVFKTVGHSYRFVFRHLGQLFRLAWLPLLLLVGLHWLAGPGELIMSAAPNTNVPYARLMAFFVAIPAFVIFIAIAVAVHRMILHGADTVGPYLSLGRTEGYFMLVPLIGAASVFCLVLVAALPFALFGLTHQFCNFWSHCSTSQ